MKQYVTDRLDLRLGDCMDLMRDTPDGFYDLAIVDPPYGINKDGGETGKHWKRYEKKSWDHAIPSRQFFDEVRRVSVNQVIWGGNYFTDHLPPSMGWLFWDKGQELDMSDGELAWTSFQSALRRKVLNRCMISEFGGNIHPTQKPVALYSWALRLRAKPGQRILDTHLGSGSIAIACHYFGAHLTATEIDPDYFAAAVERIQRETQQIELPLATAPRIEQRPLL